VIWLEVLAYLKHWEPWRTDRLWSLESGPVAVVAEVIIRLSSAIIIDYGRWQSQCGMVDWPGYRVHHAFLVVGLRPSNEKMLKIGLHLHYRKIKNRCQLFLDHPVCNVTAAEGSILESIKADKTMWRMWQNSSYKEGSDKHNHAIDWDQTKVVNGENNKVDPLSRTLVDRTQFYLENHYLNSVCVYCL